MGAEWPTSSEVSARTAVAVIEQTTVFTTSLSSMKSGSSCIDFISVSGSWHWRAVTQSLWYCVQLELHYCLLEQLVSLCFPRGFDFDCCAVSILEMILAMQVGPV